MPKRVLTVGHCDLDHRALCRLLESCGVVEVASADRIADAIDAVRGGSYDLVLINRVFEFSGESGIDLIRKLRADPESGESVLMLVSNLEEAQQEAVAAGAVTGFGKAELDSEQTRAALSRYLN